MQAPAWAQADKLVETVPRGFFNCSHEKGVESGIGGQLKKNLKVDTLLKEVTDKRRKKYALKAAENALKAGYNYAYMSPLRIDDRRFLQETSGFGFTFNLVAGQKYKMLECVAVDDISAFQITHENKEVRKQRNPKTGFVDLRQLVLEIDGKPYDKPQKPQIAAIHFREVGSREKYSRQFPVMQQAMSCSRSLKPRSISNFSYQLTSAEKSAELDCLRKLEPLGRAVGLTFVSLKTSIENSSGYTVNPNVDGSAETTIQTGAIDTFSKPLDKKVWGKNWVDQTSLFPGFDGQVLFLKESSKILIGSNTVQDRELLDYVVYTVARNSLGKDKEGIRVRKNDEITRDRFQRKRDYYDSKGEYGKDLSSLNDTRFDHKAPFRIFTDYKYAFYSSFSNTSSSKRPQTCFEYQLICTDILAAYNALGPKLGARDFEEISTPPGYVPYVTK